MEISEIAFVAYPVKDLKRARQFYEDVLGLTVSRAFGTEHIGFVEYDIGPGTLAITNYDPKWKPCSGGCTSDIEINDVEAQIPWSGRSHRWGCMASLEVDDLTAAVDEVIVRGFGTIDGPHESPVCHLAFVKDPDGNSIILHERKPCA